jgi:hypothetical protein
MGPAVGVAITAHEWLLQMSISDEYLPNTASSEHWYTHSDGTKLDHWEMQVWGQEHCHLPNHKSQSQNPFLFCNGLLQFALTFLTLSGTEEKFPIPLHAVVIETCTGWGNCVISLGGECYNLPPISSRCSSVSTVSAAKPSFTRLILLLSYLSIARRAL